MGKKYGMFLAKDDVGRKQATMCTRGGGGVRIDRTDRHS